MGAETVGILAVVFFLILAFLRFPIGFALLSVGFAGYWYLDGLDPALLVLRTIPYRLVTNYNFTCIPLFGLLGQLACYSGLSGDAYRVAAAFVGHVRGGMAIATTLACALFSAVIGNSGATILTFAGVSIPEMRKLGYDDRISTAVLANGAILGPMIPPSTIMIIYAFLTEGNIGYLFMAGIIPGILLTLLYSLTIYTWCRINPSIAGVKIAPTTWKTRITTAPQVWGIVVMFVTILGGIYSGIFTPTEAGAIGAFAVLVLGVVRRRLGWASFWKALMDTGRILAMIIILFTGVWVFNSLLALSRIPFILGEFYAGLEVSRWVIMAIIMLTYVIAGFFLDCMAVVFITVPILHPTVMAMGFDTHWFAVLIVLVAGLGTITPPYGINVFTIAGIVSDVPMWTIFRGCYPFILANIIGLIVLIAFPTLSTWLPSLMKPG